MGMKKLLQLIIIGQLSLFSIHSFSQQIVDTTKIFGVTIDNPFTNINGIKTALSNHCVKPTVRVVFDKIAASEYVEPVTQIKSTSFIMGELLDSYYFDQYSLTQYNERTTEYYNTLGDLVDIWEIGNEVNGEWLGDITKVVDKIYGAYKIIKPTGRKTAITLYFNRGCYSDLPNEMFNWVNKRLPVAMKKGLDYVFVSYYEDDCKNNILSQSDWQEVFDSLHVIFPNSKLGMGECGSSISSKKAKYMDRYYRMELTTPGYVAGNFWWYYKQDCVPNTKPLWDTLNSIVCDVYTNKIDYPAPSNVSLLVYPNPASDEITIETQQEINEGTLIISNINGQELMEQTINESKTQIDISNLESGIYYIKLIIDESFIVREIIKE
jgi:hypothetical protein